MSLKDLFREVAIKNAKEQGVIVNDFIEEAPIWAGVPMQPASHGMRNVFEKLVSVDSFKKLEGLDSPLPSVNTATTLGFTDLSVFGGIIEGGEDKINEYGSKDAYFGDKLRLVMKQTAASFENALLYQSFRPKAVELGKQIKAGGTTANKQYSLICVKWAPGETTGLYNEKGFGDGKVFVLEAMNGGNRYFVETRVPGYGMTAKGNFGLQLEGDNVASIVNIDLAYDATGEGGFKNLPTEAMIDDLIYSVKGGMNNTVILGHPRALGAISYYKRRSLMMAPGDMSYPGQLSDWTGVPMIGSYNFDFGTEAVVS